MICSSVISRLIREIKDVLYSFLRAFSVGNGHCGHISDVFLRIFAGSSKFDMGQPLKLIKQISVNRG